jgi:hypothetical protein
VTGRRVAGSLAGASTVLAIGLLCVEVSAPGALGCTTHQCDTSFACVYPAGLQHGPCADNAGSVTLDDEPVYQDGDELVWYSAPFNRDWLELRGNETLSIFFPPKIHDALVAQGPNALPTALDAWVSSDPTDASDSPEASVLVRNFTAGVGQLVEYTRMDQNAVDVLNDTCAAYSFRIEVRAAVGPLAAADASSPTSTDAGVDGTP